MTDVLLSAHPTTHSTNCPFSLAPDTMQPLKGCVASTIHTSEPAWRQCHSTPPKTEPTAPSNTPGTPKPSTCSLRWLNITRVITRVKPKAENTRCLRISVSTLRSWSPRAGVRFRWPRALVWCSVACTLGTTKGLWLSVLHLFFLPFLIRWNG